MWLLKQLLLNELVYIALIVFFSLLFIHTTTGIPYLYIPAAIGEALKDVTQ